MPDFLRFTTKEAQIKRLMFFLAPLDQIPVKGKVCFPRPPPLVEPDTVDCDPAHLIGVPIGCTLVTVMDEQSQL